MSASNLGDDLKEPSGWGRMPKVHGYRESATLREEQIKVEEARYR